MRPADLPESHRARNLVFDSTQRFHFFYSQRIARTVHAHPDAVPRWEQYEANATELDQLEKSPLHHVSHRSDRQPNPLIQLLPTLGMVRIRGGLPLLGSAPIRIVRSPFFAFRARTTGVCPRILQDR